MGRITKIQVQKNMRKQTMSAAELVTAGIKRQLVERRIKAGDQLPAETELCELYGVGRSTLREGIKTLCAQGILELRKGVGTFVSDGRGQAFYDTLFYNLYLADPDGQEIEILRRLLERNVLELIIKNHELNRDYRIMLNENFRELEIMTENGVSGEQLLTNDMEFHKIMADACKNHVIGSIYRCLIDFLQSSMADAYPYQSVQRVVQSHRAILSVIERDDIDNVQKAIDFSLDPWNKKQK